MPSAVPTNRMRYRLRTLMILLTFGPPVVAGALIASKDSWPLFLALGVMVYIAASIVVAVIVGNVLAWAIDESERLLRRN